jgi:hypothetical protein
MERTESKVLETVPQRENDVISIMEHFGWNLQGRQEMHYEGNSVTKPDIFSGFGGYYSYTTYTQIHHYTKLHFTRAMNTPNLNRIKTLENEYFNMDYPVEPKMFSVGIWLWIILLLVYGLGIPIWIAYYFLSYKPNKVKFDLELARIQNRAKEIETEIYELLR